MCAVCTAEAVVTLSHQRLPMNTLLSTYTKWTQMTKTPSFSESWIYCFIKPPAATHAASSNRAPWAVDYSSHSRCSPMAHLKPLLQHPNWPSLHSHTRNESKLLLDFFDRVNRGRLSHHQVFNPVLSFISTSRPRLPPALLVSWSPGSDLCCSVRWSSSPLVASVGPRPPCCWQCSWSRFREGRKCHVRRTSNLTNNKIMLILIGCEKHSIHSSWLYCKPSHLNNETPKNSRICQICLKIKVK